MVMQGFFLPYMEARQTLLSHAQARYTCFVNRKALSVTLALLMLVDITLIQFRKTQQPTMNNPLH